MPVYRFPALPRLPSSDLCHNLSAHSHSSPALIYISEITSGPCCTRGSAAGFSTHLPPGLLFLGRCLFSSRLISSLCCCFFFCLCLSSFLSLQLFPLFSIPILPFLLICCVYMRLDSLRPKRWFCSHLRCQILPSFRDSLFLQTLPTISHTLYELFPFKFSQRHVWCLHR